MMQAEGALPPLPANGCELILIRHGQSTANAQGIGQGRTDWPLSELGRQQAEATASLVSTFGAIAAVYTSPLTRAADTAAPIAARCDLAAVSVPELVEIDIGALSGLTWDELVALHPEAMSVYAAAEQARPHPRNRELIPGWEPLAAIIGRTWHAIGAIAERHPRERAVVVAHGGVLNAFLTQLLTGDALEALWTYHVGNCAVTHLRLAPGGLEILRLRDLDHVRGLSADLTALASAPRQETP